MSGQFRVIIYSLEIISWDVKGTSQVPLTSHKPKGNFGCFIPNQVTPNSPFTSIMSLLAALHRVNLDLSAINK